MSLTLSSHLPSSYARDSEVDFKVTACTACTDPRVPSLRSLNTITSVRSSVECDHYSFPLHDPEHSRRLNALSPFSSRGVERGIIATTFWHLNLSWNFGSQQYHDPICQCYSSAPISEHAHNGAYTKIGHLRSYAETLSSPAERAYLNHFLL